MNYINEKIATADTSFIGYLYKLDKEALGSKMTDATMDDEKLSTVLDTYINHQEKIKNIVKAEKILIKTEEGSPLIGNTNPEIRQYIINMSFTILPIFGHWKFGETPSYGCLFLTCAKRESWMSLSLLPALKKTLFLS